MPPAPPPHPAPPWRPRAAGEGWVDLHATAVAHGGRALVLGGASGSGKSATALELMAFGAGLIADDAVRLVAQHGGLIATAPPGALPAIEGRGLGLLPAALDGPAAVAALVDLGRVDEDRLPERRTLTLLGHEVALLRKPAIGPVAAALLQYLRGTPGIAPAG
ncbi:MAG: HPr kinase/phosphorylase [Shimia sp.]